MPTVYLITPPKSFGEKAIMGLKWTTPHIGLGYLSSYISQFGYETKIFDLKFFPLGKFLQELEIDRPKVIGITAFTEEISSVKRVLGVIKEIDSSIVTVLGGPHATALPSRSLKDIKILDFCVYGEGEISFKELLDAIFVKGQEFGHINGISFRKKHKICINQPRKFNNSLDGLPFPDWEKFDLSYYTPFGVTSKKKGLELPLLSQRGCPYQCIFCQKTMGNQARPRSVDNLITEIKTNYEKFGNSYISILDETFTLDKKRVIEFCNRFRKEKLNELISWSCLTRVNLIDEELIKNLKLAGCRLISFGIESGNDRILKIIKKGITTDQARKAIALGKKYQIITHCGIIFGHPFETRQTMWDSLHFILKNRPDLVTFSILVPFPGTQVSDFCQTHYGGLKMIAENWLDFEHQMGHALELDQLPRRDLEIFQVYAYIRFFLHPRNILNFFGIVNVRSIPKFLLEKLRGIFKSGRRSTKSYN